MKIQLTIAAYLLIVIFFMPGCVTNEVHQDERPNILFFLIDDQRDDVMSCAGHSVVKTPTIDKLAETGIRFTNAFVTTSICAASRATILTGLYECKHNYTFGKDPIKKKFATMSYPYLLKESGYNTGFIGKLGVKIEKQDSMLVQMFDYYKPSPRSTPHFVTQPDGSQRHSAEIKGDEAIDFIDQQTAGKPFCLSISFNAVHAVDGNKTPGNEGHYPYPKAVENLYENIDMPKPDLADPEIFENHPDFLKNSFNRERYFWRWDTEEKYQTNMRAYLRMISGYDKVMNRVLAHLKNQRLDKNTVIIYSSDNGYYMGNRGFAGKWSHYEESLRIPMIIVDPRLPKASSGKTTDKIALNIDIPATILDLAGIALPQPYQGASMLPILKNENQDSWRERFLCEHRMENDKIPKYVGIRGKRYVYANYYTQNPAYEYLHDLEGDPNQLINLVDNSEYEDILQKMRKECKALESKLIK